MTLTDTAYANRVEAPGTFAEVLDRTRAALTEAGFGILCEIDVQANMRSGLGIEREPYTIIGACNARLAHRALEAEPQLGALLPCNVVVFAHEGAINVSAVSAEQMLGLVGNPALEPVGREVDALLAGVLSRATRAGR